MFVRRGWGGVFGLVGSRGWMIVIPSLAAHSASSRLISGSGDRDHIAAQTTLT